MKKNNIRLDLCRDGCVMGRLYLPLKYKDEKTDFEAVQSILYNPAVKDFIDWISGSDKPNDNQYAEQKEAFTEDEMCKVGLQLNRIEDAVAVMRETLHIARETPELPF